LPKIDEENVLFVYIIKYLSKNTQATLNFILILHQLWKSKWPKYPIRSFKYKMSYWNNSLKT